MIRMLTGDDNPVSLGAGTGKKEAWSVNPRHVGLGWIRYPPNWGAGHQTNGIVAMAEVVTR